LDVPTDKPVVVLDQDEIEIGGVMLRLHVHGFTNEIHPPTPFIPPKASAAALAAAMLIGATAGCDPPGAKGPDDGPTATAAATVTIESATTSTSSDTTTDSETGSTSASDTTSSAAPEATGAATATTTKPIQNKPPIEVRPRPPAPMRRDPSDP
jgi:predicted component of type VI protein secretion system